MPVTITYDLSGVAGNHRTWIRSMLERFGFRRLGGSVFRYEGQENAAGDVSEDWLNHVAPAITLLRSYVLRNNLLLARFTVDAHSVAFVDHSDPAALYGTPVQRGDDLTLIEPTNPQAGEASLRAFVDACAAASPEFR